MTNSTKTSLLGFPEDSISTSDCNFTVNYCIFTAGFVCENN